MYAIHNIVVYLENEMIERGSVLVEGTKIKQVARENIPAETVVDGKGYILVPGMIDGHIHGAHGTDVMDEDPGALQTMSKKLPKEGTTSFLATTITSPTEQLDQAVERVQNFQQPEGAELLGAHIEGPFINVKKKGAQPESCIIDPDVQQARRWANTGVVKAMTFAPELDQDRALLNFLNEHQIVSSAGHTDADFAQVKDSVAHGLKQLTHLCNAMNGVHHRDVGAVGAAMLLPEVKAEIIADRIHVSDEMLQILFETVTPERLIMITDAMRAKGMADGEYPLGDQTVTVANGKATLADGTLAGSVLTMDQAARNMIDICGASVADVIQMASVNPAKMYNVYDRKGSISEGKDADFLLIDERYRIQATYCRGVNVYDASHSN
ncbi:N-acetylglucosamine-6-phosphate deacetylase [Halalkalibacillus halophilus]|uniref:N-acetylglucosamine-6-phosphate deacetylase n=1 Tax=Halalkalibacillus halophilus TaxID=392827 RepID=UPI00041DDD53|nr:N-acetylglucosamine-6-phosphate deacetylase [Halalkalibacillus halophilus]